MAKLRRASVVLVIASCVHGLLGTIAFIRAPRPAPDFDRYYQIAAGHGRPYVDYHVEHPIGTLAIFKMLVTAAGIRSSFGRGVVALNFAATACLVGVLWQTWGVGAAAFYMAVSAPLAGLLFTRLDFWSMAAASVSVAAWRRRRSGLAAASLAIAASLKLWPLVLMPMFASRTRVSRAAFAACSTAVIAILAAAMTVSGRAAARDVLTFRGAHGWQIECTVGSVIHLLSEERPREESGSWRIGTMDSTTSVVLFSLAAPVCLAVARYAFAVGEIGTGWVGAVSWLLVFSALLSAQYVGWLLPGAAIAFAERRRRVAAMTAAVALLTAAYWTIFSSVIEGAPLAMLLLLARNALLIALAVDATRSVARASTAGAATGV